LVVAKTGERMRHRRLKLCLVVGVSLLTSTLGLPAAGAASMSAGAAPGNSAPAWVDTGRSAGCAAAAHVLTPTRSPSYYAAHPQALLAHSADVSPQVSQALKAVAAAKIHYLAGISCSAGHSGKSAPNSHASAALSTNWAGYTDTGYGGGPNYLATTMQWRVPTIVGPSDRSVVSSIWPGIGSGLNTADTLIQAGTEQDSLCTPGCRSQVPSYYFWFELYPQERQQVVTNLAVYPGDLVSTIAEYDPDTRTAYFQLNNLTTGQGVYASQLLPGPSAGSGRQGEWIVERTRVGNLLPSLANFQTQTITNASAAIGPRWTAPSYLYANNSALRPTATNMIDQCSTTTLTARATPFTANGRFAVIWGGYGKFVWPSGC
jgi:Peptidase A4 family